jgi:hypothetical protein
VVWLVAPEFATQSVTGVGGAGAVELRQPARGCVSHNPNHDNCYGGGSVNEGPTCCTGKPYWGAAEKACDVDQYGAPPTGRRTAKREHQRWCLRGLQRWLQWPRGQQRLRRCLRGRQRQLWQPRAVPAGAGACGTRGSACGGANDGACGGASDGCGGPGASGARGGACEGTSC